MQRRSTSRRGALLVLAALAGAGCMPPTPPAPDGGPHECSEVVGDATLAPVVQLIGLDPNMMAFTLADGGMDTLAFPPQGGRVIFAGVRATNLDRCGVQLGGVVRDTTTQRVSVDSRTVNLLATGDGWAASNPADISTFNNVGVCPNEWSATNLYGTPYQLEVTLTDRSGRTATQTLEVTPECSEPAHAAECLCICKGGYVLGEACAGADGGAGDAGDGGDGGA